MNAENDKNRSKSSLFQFIQPQSQTPRGPVVIPAAPKAPTESVSAEPVLSMTPPPPPPQAQVSTQQQQQVAQSVPSQPAVQRAVMSDRLESYVKMAAEMQTLLKQEKARADSLSSEIRKIREQYQSATESQLNELGRLRSEKEQSENELQEQKKRYQSLYTRAVDDQKMLESLKGEVEKMNQNMQSVHALAQSKDHVVEAQQKIAHLLDSSSAVVQRADELFRELHRRFSQLETQIGIDSKNQRQRDLDQKTGIDRIRTEIETLTNGFQFVYQHMGQYELTINSALAEVTGRNQHMGEVQRTLTRIRELQEAAQLAATQGRKLIEELPVVLTRKQAFRVLRRASHQVSGLVHRLEDQIVRGFKNGARSAQVDSAIQKIEELQRSAITTISRLESIENKLLGDQLIGAIQESLVATQQARADLMERMAQQESSTFQLVDKIRKDVESIRAEAEFHRGVILNNFEPPRSDRGETASVSKPAPSASALSVAGPLSGLLNLKESELTRLEQEIKTASDDQTRARLQVIIDSTTLQRDQISRLIQRTSNG